MFDAETCFQVPILPEYVVDGGGRVHNLVELGGSAWGVDDRVLQRTTVVGVLSLRR